MEYVVREEEKYMYKLGTKETNCGSPRETSIFAFGLFGTGKLCWDAKQNLL